jgi:dCMP deaminase
MLKQSWDEYFLDLAKKVATRSIDPSTKHGCVITKDKKILSTGYNGPISNIDDSKVPLTRPDKYFWMIHAEQSALLFCNDDCSGGTAYITGFPCHVCFKLLAQKNLTRIAYGNLFAKCLDEKEIFYIKQMAELKNIKLDQIEI